MNINQQNNVYLQKVSSRLVRILSNLKFAIFILLIIAGFSVFGTIIEQNQSTDFYKQNYPENKAVFGLLNWGVIKFFNLDDVYRSWWYLSLLIILGLSLVTCSFTQQLPMLKIAKNWKFLTRTQQLKNVDLKVKLKGIDSSDIIYQLSQETYNTFQQENCFYCYKGIIGRIAPIFVHVSIIQIFIGALFGAFFGYGGQEMIPKNETFHLQNIINAGYFSKTPISTNLRINNFWIDYMDKENGVVNQFYSDISLLNNKGEEIRRKTISVNNPLHYKDLTLYQSDWDILGIRGRLINRQKELQYQVKKIKTTNGNRWLSQIKNNEGIGYNRNILIKELKKEVSLYDEKGEYLKKIEEGESFDLKGQQFILDEILPATGIDVKSDPGIPFVYFGFVLLIISTLLSFVSYSRIWVFSIENNLYIGGKSNRAKIAFERYFLKQLSKLKRLG